MHTICWDQGTSHEASLKLLSNLAAKDIYDLAQKVVCLSQEIIQSRHNSQDTVTSREYRYLWLDEGPKSGRIKPFSREAGFDPMCDHLESIFFSGGFMLYKRTANNLWRHTM